MVASLSDCSRCNRICETTEFEQTKRILAAFDRHKVDYVVGGGMALAAQGLVRATRDLDVVVAAETRNVDRLKTALRELFDDPEIDSIRAEELAGDNPAIPEE